MPQRDFYHQAVKSALLKDGWTITHDPYTLTHGLHRVFIDLGAERLLAAERGAEKIAVEIKSFVGYSEVSDLEDAVGQYLVYRSVLSRRDPQRHLVLAIPVAAFDSILQADIGRAVREDYAISILVFDQDKEVVTTWLK